ncbi:hypothetical protein L6164_017257 [Bauhinia variegata]|uniref:Uncharacterized protein n=1 Tax=Bauhinia variegata TaxID=167791 RepID=A0ACB9N759_BAUVA|nr:hypothetical protein L6164_017257 [Bauhinia variegata]
MILLTAINLNMCLSYHKNNGHSISNNSSKLRGDHSCYDELWSLLRTSCITLSGDTEAVTHKTYCKFEKILKKDNPGVA